MSLKKIIGFGVHHIIDNPCLRMPKVALFGGELAGRMVEVPGPDIRLKDIGSTPKAAKV